MDQKTKTDLKLIRREIIDSLYRGGGHVGGALSIVEILYVLHRYYLVEDKNDFILSKGHAVPALYATLKFFGILSESEYKSYGTFGTKLIHHPSVTLEHIKYSSGALGNGLSVGVGMALANKVLQNDKKVFVVMGDGELNEGTAWEGFMYAGSKGVKNIVAIIDKNNLQASDKTKNLIKTTNLIKGIKSLGWKVINISGSDVDEIKNVLDKSYKRPVAIILNTVKGRGISFMEDDVTWHHRKLTEDEFKLAMKELS